MIKKFRFYIVKFKHNLWYGILKIFKIQECARIPMWLMCIKFFIYPLNTFLWWLNRKHTIYDITTGIYTIYGTRYSDMFFWHLSKYGINTGAIFKIDRRIDRKGECYFTLTELK